MYTTLMDGFQSYFVMTPFEVTLMLYGTFIGGMALYYLVDLLEKNAKKKREFAEAMTREQRKKYFGGD